MNKNNYLSKKDQKMFARLVGKKLKEMGVKDEIQFMPSNKVRQFYKRKDDGTLEVGEDGQFVVQDVTMPIAYNPFRRHLKSILNSPVNHIVSFLNVQVAAKPEDIKEMVANENEGTIEAEVVKE